MENYQIIISVTSAILTIMMSIIGFFVVRLIKKLDTIDEKMDFQITKQNEYDYRINKVELKVDKQELSIEEIDKRLLTLETEHKNHHRNKQ